MDLVPFNGSLYVSMVTGKTDATTGVNHKQGFAVYRGDPKADGTWNWTPIIGDTSKGAKYEFGLGKKESCKVTCSHMATISISAAITTRCLTSPKSVMPVISSLSMKI